MLRVADGMVSTHRKQGKLRTLLNIIKNYQGEEKNQEQKQVNIKNGKDN